MIFAKVKVKTTVKAVDGSIYLPTFVVYQISLIWEPLFDSKHERSVHNGQANVAPRSKYPGQQNYHQKTITNSWFTDRAIMSFPTNCYHSWVLWQFLTFRMSAVTCTGSILKLVWNPSFRNNLTCSINLIPPALGFCRNQPSRLVSRLPLVQNGPGWTFELSARDNIENFQAYWWSRWSNFSSWGWKFSPYLPKLAWWGH